MGTEDLALRTGVLFVCLGNICRSPLAWGLFRHLAAERGVLDRFDVESCGTGGWHAGNAADPRSIAVSLRHGVPLDHIARQLDPARDFERFTWLIPMDRANRTDLLKLGAQPDRVRLMRSFDPLVAQAGDGPDVPDPYYGGEDGFQKVYEMLDRACRGLLDELE